MAGKKFDAKQIKFTFRDSKSGTSKIFISNNEMYSINNYLFAEVAAGNIAEVIFQETGNQLTAQTAGQTDLMAFNVEDVVYTGRQEKITQIADKKLDVELKRVTKEFDAL